MQALLGHKRGGYFIDLAANDAFVISNTYVLETHYGWHGLAVEPNPIYHPAHRAMRPNSTLAAVAVSDTNTVANFKFNGVFGKLGMRGGGKAGGDNSTRVRVVRTDDLFREYAVPPVIDFMSLDVEGHEASVLAAFPWDTHTVSILTLEKPSAEIVATLLAHHYRQACMLHELDGIFLHWPTWKGHPGVHALVSGREALRCERSSSTALRKPPGEMPAEDAASYGQSVVCTAAAGAARPPPGRSGPRLAATRVARTRR